MNFAKFLCVTVAALSATSNAYADEVPVEKLLGELKNALVTVSESSDAEGLPPLKSAVLNLSTIQKKSAGGTFKLFIIEFGKKKSSELTSDISITLTPPPKGTGKGVATPQIADIIAEAILSSNRAVKAAQASSPPLILSELKSSVKFGLSQDGNGKLKIEFAPVTVGVDGSTAVSTSQQIVLTFAAK